MSETTGWSVHLEGRYYKSINGKRYQIRQVRNANGRRIGWVVHYGFGRYVGDWFNLADAKRGAHAHAKNFLTPNAKS